MLLSATLVLALARSLEFERVEVEWLAKTGQVHDLEEVLPRHQAELIRLLGNPNFTVRQLAEAELVRMGQDASRALAWGMRAKDRQIASTASRLRDQLYLCPDCAGTGRCHACQGTSRVCSDRCNRYMDCNSCDGVGDARFYMTFVNGKCILCRRDLFAREKKCCEKISDLD